MKIHQILDNISIPLTNEEHAFVEKHNDTFSLEKLHDRDRVVAHNLVRKGVYDISKHSDNLIKKL